MTVNVELVGVIIVGVGLIATWVRNGRSNAKAYGRFEEKVDELVKEATEMNEKVDEINKDTTAMKVNCAKTSASLGQKVKNLEGEVFGTVAKRRRRKKTEE